MHEVLVNRLGGLSLPRKSVVRLTDRPDMTLDVYRGRKTTNQQFNSHKLVQKLFHNLHIIFSNSLMGFEIICQLEKEALKGLDNVQKLFSYTIIW